MHKEAAAQYLFAPDSFIEIKNDVMVNHPNPDFNELKDDSWGRNVAAIFQINRSTYPKGCYLRSSIKKDEYRDNDYYYSYDERHDVDVVLAFNEDNKKIICVFETIGLHRQLTIKILRTLTCAKKHVWANGVVTYAPTLRQLVLLGIFVWRMKIHQERALLENLGTKSGSRLEDTARTSTCPQGKHGRLSGQTSEKHACACNPGTWGIEQCVKCSFPNICTGGTNCTR